MLGSMTFSGGQSVHVRLITLSPTNVLVHGLHKALLIARGN